MTEHADSRMTPALPAWCEAMAALLDRQAGLLSRLDALSRGQRELIERDDAEGLLRVLGERERVVEGLTASAVEIEGMKQRWESVERDLPQVEVARMRRRLEAVRALAEEIAARDESDRGVLVRRRDALASELVGVSRGRRAADAYGGAGERGARFQDQEG